MNTNERIRVLIVENIPQVSKHFKNMLNLMDNVEVINELPSAQEAIEFVRSAHPDVALVDTNLPDMNGTKLTEIIRRDFPETQVIVISQDRYFETAIKALRDGASDFIIHDVSLEDLGAAINRAVELGMIAKEKQQPTAAAGGTKAVKPKGGDAGGKIISVYSPKGGAGVTTIAINLAIALQDAETAVALVDGSVQYGDVAVSLNEVSRFSMVDLVPRIYELDKKVVEDTMVFHKSSGLHVLAAPSRPELAEKITGENFHRILEFTRDMFPYIIVNTSAFISDPCLAALDAGDMVVLVTTQEISAIRSARAFLDLWDGLELSKDRIVLVLNRYNKQIPITPERVSERLKHPVALTIPDDPETVFRSSNLGIPFMLEEKELPVCKNMRVLADMVRKGVPELAEEPRVRLFSLA